MVEGGGHLGEEGGGLPEAVAEGERPQLDSLGLDGEGGEGGPALQVGDVEVVVVLLGVGGVGAGDDVVGDVDGVEAEAFAFEGGFLDHVVVCVLSWFPVGDRDAELHSRTLSDTVFYSDLK